MTTGYETPSMSQDPHREILLRVLASIRTRYEISLNKTRATLAVLDDAMIPYPNSPLEPLEMLFDNLVRDFTETATIFNEWSSVYYLVRFLEP